MYNYSKFMGNCESNSHLLGVKNMKTLVAHQFIFNTSICLTKYILMSQIIVFNIKK